MAVTHNRRCAACGGPCGDYFRMEPEAWPVCGPCVRRGEREKLRTEAREA